MAGKRCCTPSSGRTEVETSAEPRTSGSAPPALLPTREIAGGTALLGTDRPLFAIDEEGPCRTKTIKPFWMMETTVTNEMFAAFVADTGYVSEAERFGWHGEIQATWSDSHIYRVWKRNRPCNHYPLANSERCASFNLGSAMDAVHSDTDKPLLIS